MNNRARQEVLPEGKKADGTFRRNLKEAINCQFDDFGHVLMPRPGRTKVYTGTNVHSLYQGPTITLFVDNGVLKKLNSDYTATTLRTGIGSERLSYTHVGDVVYYANSSVSGRIVNGIAREWGTARPPFQPSCSALESGDLFAGDYRVAITWLGSAAPNAEESGTGMGKRVTLAAGGGIRAYNFPTPPSYVTQVAVWVSSVNSKDMYLYGEYPPTTTEVTITKNLNAVALQTQFGYPPAPQGLIHARYGRIYYARGARVYWTAPRRYGLQFANSFWRFDSNVQMIASVLGSMYIGTQRELYRITGIDAEGPPTRQLLADTGAVKGAVAYDPNSNTVYFTTDRGFYLATENDVRELTFEDIEMGGPFEEGAMALMESGGFRYLVGSHLAGTATPTET